MTTAYTSLLGLALPVTGELSGTWGDTVNNSITSLLDSAIAGTQTLTADTTLTTTTGAANQSRQAILLCSPASANITITAPAQSKIYTVINTSATYTVKICGVGPTTGVTLGVSEKAVVAWNGSDFIKISNTAGAGTFTNLTVTGVADFADGTAALPSITNTGDTNTGIFFPAADTVGVTTGGSERVRIDSSGNFGIGVTPSASFSGAKVLQIGLSGYIYANTAVNQILYSNNQYINTSGTRIYLNTGFAQQYAQDNSGNHTWSIAPSGTAGNTITFTQAMTLDASGNLGIGTTAPETKLHIKSASTSLYSTVIAANKSLTGFGTVNYTVTDISTDGTFAASQWLVTRNTGVEQYAYMGAVANSAGFSPDIVFGQRTASTVMTERMRIDSSGNVGIGTSSPTTKVQITRTALSGFLSRTSATLTLEDTAGTELYFASNTAGYGQLRFGDTDSNFRGAFTYDHSVDSMYFVTAGSERMRIDSSGNVGIGTSTPVSKLQVSNSTNGGTVEITAANTYYLSTSTDETVAFQGEFFQNDVSANRAAGYMQIGKSSDFSNNANASAFMAFATRNAGTIAEKMRIDSSGNLGIGTTNTAGYALAIERTSNNALLKLTAVTSGGAGIDLINAGGSEISYVGASGNNVLTFRTGGTERVRINSSGNVGIGVTPSAWLSTTKVLQIGDRASIFTNSSEQTLVGNNVYVNSSSQNTYIETAQASLYQQAAGLHYWYNAPSGTADAAITFTQAMTLDASGRLLVGLTSTNSAFGGKLQVEGTSDAFASLVRYSSAAIHNPVFYFGRSKSATLGTNTILALNDALGNIVFAGANGTGYSDAAHIQGVVDGTPGASADMPGRLVFSTSADGSATPTERLRIDSSGNVLVKSAAGLGYGTGSGGTVTQLTNRTTGVTLSKPTGAITMFSAAGSVVAATFTVTNTLVVATDTIILNQKSGTNLYVLLVTAVAAGSFNITFYTTGGVATDAPVINFALIKGVTA